MGFLFLFRHQNHALKKANRFGMATNWQATSKVHELFPERPGFGVLVNIL